MSIYNIFKPIQRRVRKFFRNRMLPMSVDEAEEKREFFAKLYFLSAFTFFTYMIYQLYKQEVKNINKSIPIGEATIENLKVDGNIRIIRFEGFKKVKDYYYQRKQSNEEEQSKNENSDPELLVETIPAGKMEALSS